MAIRQSGVPQWVKLTIGAAGLVLLVMIGAMALGHNPLHHLMDHSGLTQ